MQDFVRKTMATAFLPQKLHYYYCATGDRKISRGKKPFYSVFLGCFHQMIFFSNVEIRLLKNVCTYIFLCMYYVLHTSIPGLLRSSKYFIRVHI